MLDRIAAAASALLVGAGSVIGIRSGTEEPRFIVLERVGEIEVREYGPRLVAATVVAGADAVAARSEGFQRLAGYIFGGNSGGQKIAMTAPVTQTAGERIAMTAPVTQKSEPGGWTVRLFLPADRTRASLPNPNDARVSLDEVPAGRVAALRFAGVPTLERLQERRAALAATLAGSAWRPTGSGEDWFFDPPWTLPPLRRNEVVVPVGRAG